LKDVFLKWSRKRYSERQKFMALIPAGILFSLILPLTLVFVSSIIDSYFELKGLILEPFNYILAIPLIFVGLLFSAWSVWVQFRLGRGTPLPMMPTQRLIIDGPYAYCRNPMTFGILIYYIGLDFWVNSLSMIMLIALLASLLILYIKLIEEKELEARFGQEYLEYKKRTPFLIPRRRRVKE